MTTTCGSTTTPSPPPNFLELKDINTGLAFRVTYEKDIAPNPKTELGRTKVLCPVVLYMDACTTGSFMNLSLEIVKFTLGIFNRKARDKEHCWRNMGAVPKYVSAKTRAKDGIRESSHTKATDYLTDSDDDSDADDIKESFCPPSMDCHD